MSETALVIPMAGYGNRFREKGYKDYKPFIKVNGKYMIDWVLNSFPEDIEKHFICNRGLLSEDQIDYLKNKTNSNVIFIPGHKDGGAFSIYSAREELPKDKSLFVAYCDVRWTWDWEEVKTLLDQEAIVFTQSGFHPHLIKDPYNCFCLPRKDNPKYLDTIKEKGSFTDDHTKEPQSMGVFYVKEGKTLIDAVSKMIADNKRVAGEYYLSEAFNYVEKNIYLHDVNFYIHWGVPEKLEDFNKWVDIFTRNKDSEKMEFENVCCMGGKGERMRDISELPKALVPIEGYPMFELAMKKFPVNKNRIIVTDEMAGEVKTKEEEFDIINIGVQTNSQIETLERAIPELQKSKNFFLTSCDCYGIYDQEEFRNFVSKEQPDAVVFTYAPSLVQNKLSSNHSHVSLDGSKITGLHIKSKSSDEDRCFGGFFWFKDGNIFNEIKNMSNQEREMYADDFLKHLIENGSNVVSYPLDHFVHVGSKEEFLEYEYWKQHKEALLDGAVDSSAVLQ